MKERSELRKVTFTKNYQTVSGYFHQWGITNGLNRSGFDDPKRVAIIELEEGQIMEVDPQEIVFVSNPIAPQVKGVERSMLRKVMFKDDDAYEKAYFHDWITAPFSAHDDREFQITVGLVELTNGRVSHALLDEIKFVEGWY
jgi:hypothetical protein